MAEGFKQFGLSDTLPYVLAKRAEWTPDRVFLQQVGQGSQTYAQFLDTTLTWSDALRRLGVQAGDRVAVMLPAAIETAAAWLGTAWLQAIEVPINTDYRSDMLHYLLADSGSKILITLERYLNRLAEVASGLPALEAVVVLDAAAPLPDIGVRLLSRSEFLDGARPAGGLEMPKPWHVQGILYTGGTTGPSKGVIMPWGFLTLMAHIFEHLGPDDAYYVPFPMFHGTGKAPLTIMAFAGGRDVIREQWSTRDFWSDIDQYGCTVTTLLPAMSSWLLGQEPGPADTRHALKEVLMVGNIEAFRRRFGVMAHTQFGQTESGNPIFRRDVTDNFASCGRLRPGFQARIVDERDYEVPVGAVGELVIRTDQPWTMNLGYFGKPEKTVENWRNGWVHTGDAFRRDADGNYYFIDRQRDYMRRRGENISSFEVEAIVARHPDVAEVAAIGVPSEHGEDEVKILVVCKDGRELAPEPLIRFLIPIMPRFMVPRYVEFVTTLPRTQAMRQVRKVELRINPLNANTWDREAAGIIIPR